VGGGGFMICWLARGGGGGGGEGENVKKKREKKRWTQMDEQTANVGPTPSLNLISSGK